MVPSHRAHNSGFAAIQLLPRSLEQRSPYSPLEDLYRSVPWVLLVAVGVLGKWTPEQIQAVIVCLIPVILVGLHKTQRV